jgi:hypothetical protein
MPRVARGIIAVGVAIAGVAGCAQVLGIESDRHLSAAPDTGVAPTTDAGSPEAAPPADVVTIDAAGLPSNFACLGDPVPPTPDGSVMVEFFLNNVSGASSSTTGTPVPGTLIHPCNKLDILCSSPFPGATTDDGGLALLSVPGGFDGYYEAISDAGYTPAVLSRTPALVDEYASQGVADISLLSAGAGLAGLQQDPSLSIAIVTVADCTSTPAENMVISVEEPGPNEQVVYLVNNLPNKGATKTDLASGSALIFNVPAGSLVVSASFATDGGLLMRQVTTIARQNWVTFVQLRPDQATVTPL